MVVQRRAGRADREPSVFCDQPARRQPDAKWIKHRLTADHCVQVSRKLRLRDESLETSTIIVLPA